MTLNFVGLNASLTFPGDPNAQADRIRRLNGAFYVLCTVGDAKRAVEFADAMPQTTFIDRLVEDGDGGWWETLTPQQMVDKYAGREGRGKVVRYILNEPGIANDEKNVGSPAELARIQKFVKWCEDVLDKGAAIGERYCIFNAWAGTPHEAWISSGAFDPLIRALDKHHDQHFLGLHEGQPFITAGRDAITLKYETMKNIDAMQPSNWGDAATTPTDNAWMVGRCWRWGQRAIEINCKPPKIVLTEFTPARNDHEGAIELYRYLTGKYGVYRGRYLDGIPTLINAYKAYYGDKWPETLRDMLKWDADFYPYNVVGLCGFTDNFQDDSKQSWKEFNVGDLDTLLQVLFDRPIAPPTRTYGTTPPKPTEPPPTPVYGSVYPTTRLNARNAPNGAILGILEVGETLGLTGACKALGAFVWLQVRTRYGEAWVAHPYVAVR